MYYSLTGKWPLGSNPKTTVFTTDLPGILRQIAA